MCFDLSEGMEQITFYRNNLAQVGFKIATSHKAIVHKLSHFTPVCYII